MRTVWEKYPATYRAREMALMAKWMVTGDSGSIVGLVGCGRSHLLGYLCNRPDVVAHYLPEQADQIALIPVDIYNIPANDLSTLYRTILHAFFWVRHRFDPELQQAITQLYLDNRSEQDPFLPHTALYDLLEHFRSRNIRVVLVLNRFDRFCERATRQMMNTLRGLRDSFRGTLCYFVGMLQEVVYLPDPSTLGDMYELLVGHVCWVGVLDERDAREMLARQLGTAVLQPNATQMAKILSLSGRFPSLLKAIGQWWAMLSESIPSTEQWSDTLIHKHSIQFRLERIWQALTQEEQLALWETEKLQAQQMRLKAAEKKRAWQELSNQHARAFELLDAKGLCERTENGWRIGSELLTLYIANVEGRVRGKIWLDDTVRIIYQGQQPIDELTPLQYEILRFFILNPRAKHTRDDVIDNAWPEDEQRDGITPNALQVHIANIRKKIEPNPAKPRYLITWHGRPGGYQFFPEGKPV